MEQFGFKLLFYSIKKPKIMVKLNYAFKNGNLSLRISEKKDRYYKSVKFLLLGNPNIAENTLSIQPNK